MEYIILKDKVRLINLPESAGDNSLSFDEEIMLHQKKEIEDLKTEIKKIKK